MISNSKLYNFLIVSYFFLKLELINNLIPSIWFVFLFIIFLLAIRSFGLMSRNEKFFLIKKNIWVFLSLIILVFYKVYNYGNFRLDFMIQYLLFSLPFLIIGYNYALKGEKLNHIVFPLLILYLLTYLPTIIFYLFSGNYSRENLENIIFWGQENSGLIHLWPFLSALILVSWGLYKTIKTRLHTKILLFISWFCFMTFIFFSGYMSGVVFLITSLVSVFMFNSKKKSILKIITILPLTLYVALLFIAEYSTGATNSKSSAVLLFINSGFLLDNTILNLITSDRWTAILYSIFQFLNKPLFGHGIYLEDIAGMLGDTDKYTTASGGHNFFIDLMAYMGVFSLPLILIYTKYIKLSNQLSRISLGTNYYMDNIIIYSVFVSVFISNILNSWLLFSAFDNFIFLLAGYVCGQLYINKKNTEISKKNLKC